jgi:hypothetical protein
LKNENSKKSKKNENKTTKNIYINKSVISKKKKNINNGITNKSNIEKKNLEIHNFEEYNNNNEKTNINCSLIKKIKNKNKVKYMTNDYEMFDNDILDNYHINNNDKIILKDKDKDNKKENMENNSDINNNTKPLRFKRDSIKANKKNFEFNKKNIDNNNKKNICYNNKSNIYDKNKNNIFDNNMKTFDDNIKKNIDENFNKRNINVDNIINNNNNKANNYKYINKNKDSKNDGYNNDLIIVHKKDTYLNRRFKCLKNKEEEKSKSYNDDINNNNILSRTSIKNEKKIYYKDILAKRYTTNKKLKEIHTSIKLASKPLDLFNDCEYNTADTNIEQDENKKYNSHYLSTEKTKFHSKSTFLKNFLINTGDDFKKYNNDTDNFKNTIFRNNIKSRYQEMKKLNNFKTNQLSNDSDLSSREGGSGISALLRSEKKINCFDKNIRVSHRNSNVCNYEYVIKMLNEAIQLKNSIEIQSLFSILLINFNNKYLTTFECKELPKDVPQFSLCYKYFVIIVIPLIFLHKDETIYKNSSSEAKNIFESFLSACIENIGQKNISNKKIDSFINEYKKTNSKNKINISMEECCIELIKIIFKNYKEYSPLKKATEQLLGIIKNESIIKIINIVNDTILYCFNHKQKNSFYLLDQKIPGNRNKSLYKLNQLSEKDLNKPISTPTTPFIRCPMKKDFCLVLDIDETIVHSMNLPFGNYFLLRPGVIHFLEELSKLYEIIIFTSSPKIYADGILNKIDIDNNYISHRLYKDHVIF